jgi:hypothetical protein
MAAEPRGDLVIDAAEGRQQADGHHGAEHQSEQHHQDPHVQPALEIQRHTQRRHQVAQYAPARDDHGGTSDPAEAGYDRGLDQQLPHYPTPTRTHGLTNYDLA